MPCSVPQGLRSNLRTCPTAACPRRYCRMQTHMGSSTQRTPQGLELQPTTGTLQPQKPHRSHKCMPVCASQQPIVPPGKPARSRNSHFTAQSLSLWSPNMSYHNRPAMAASSACVLVLLLSTSMPCVRRTNFYPMKCAGSKTTPTPWLPEGSLSVSECARTPECQLSHSLVMWLFSVESMMLNQEHEMLRLALDPTWHAPDHCYRQPQDLRRAPVHKLTPIHCVLKKR